MFICPLDFVFYQVIASKVVLATSPVVRFISNFILNFCFYICSRHSFDSLFPASLERVLTWRHAFVDFCTLMDRHTVFFSVFHYMKSQHTQRQLF